MVAPMVPAAVAVTHPSSGTPAAVVALAIIAALLVFATLVWGVARWRGVEPGWWQGLRRAFVEAGWHAEAAWADFADWLRFGR